MGQPIGRAVGTGALVVLAVVVSLIAVRSWLGLRDDAERTAEAWRETDRELLQVEEALADATAELEDLRSTLEDEQDALDLRRDERDAAQEALDSTSTLLANVKAQLEAASADLEARSSRLDALVRCVVGVAGALNQASVADFPGLAATMRGIEGVCAEAGAAL